MREIDEILINEDLVKGVISTYNEDLVKTEPTIVTSSVSTKNFLDELYNSLRPNVEIFPDNCKYIKTLNNEDTLIIIEESPRVRTISLNRDLTYQIEKHKINGKYEEYQLDKFISSEDHVNNFTLSFPYIVYVILLNRFNEYKTLKIFFRLNPLTSFGDYLLKPCLPNINKNYSVCLGYNGIEYSTISEQVNNIINNFWFNKFNSDYIEFCLEYEDTPEICDFFTWQHYTKIDPLFIFSTKWKNAELNLKEVIKSIDMEEFDNFPSFYSLKDRITNRCKKIRDYTTESIILGNNILSIGDKIKYDGKLYFICSFQFSNYSLKNIKLEDIDGNYFDLALNEDNISIINQSIEKIGGIPSIMIDENTEIKEGDIVILKDEASIIKPVQKILKLKDNTIQIKIGADFYLLTKFLNKSIQKVDPDNVKINGIELIKDNMYYILDLEYTYSFFKKIIIVVYNGIKTVKNKICLEFKYPQNEKILLVSTEELNNRYKIIENEDICNEKIFRINDRIVVNDNPIFKCHLLKNLGIGVSSNGDEFFDIYYDYIKFLSSDYLAKLCKDYFHEFCDKNETTFTIKSYEKDISYSVGEEVIIIDWNIPNDMFNIRTITGFMIDDNSFYLTLVDDNSNISNYPIIKFTENGVIKNYFACVRKVCRKIDQYEVGMKVKSKIKSIADFPMKDCNVIKAFIIDDIKPLVLFSNYRTILFNNIDQMFNIFSPNDLKFNKLKESDPNMNIKTQDGDVFSSFNNENLIIAIYYNSYLYLSLSKPRVGHHTKYRDYEINSIRYGLLSPRYSLNQLGNMIPVYGLINEYGNIIKTGRQACIRTEWSIIK